MAAAAVVAGVLGVASIAQQRKANKEQRRANRIQRRQAEIQNLRERRRALAESRISAAEALSQGTLAGAQGSSGLQGAIGSLQTQTAVNIGFQEQLAQLNQQRLSALDRAAGYAGRAQIFGQAANLALQTPQNFFNPQTGPTQ